MLRAGQYVTLQAVARKPEPLTTPDNIGYDGASQATVREEFYKIFLPEGSDPAQARRKAFGRARTDLIKSGMVGMSVPPEAATAEAIEAGTLIWRARSGT